MPDDEDRPRDAQGAADSNWPVSAKGGIDWTQVGAPDDISALSRDVKSYHRECRATRRRERWHRLSARPSTAPLTMTATALVMAAVVALLLTVMSPGHNTSGPTPLAVSDTVTTTGVPGGLLPPTELVSATTGDKVASLLLRPAAVVLIPAKCNCKVLLDELAAQAYAAHHTHLAVIAPDAPDAFASSLSGQLTHGDPAVYFDPSDSLHTQLSATGITQLNLDRNGTISGAINRSISANPTTADLKTLNLTGNLEKMLAASTASG